MNFRAMGFSSEADFVHLYSNFTMVIFEEIFDEMLNTLTILNDVSNDAKSDAGLSIEYAKYDDYARKVDEGYGVSN